ncbi:MAG TPA: addiction module protein [Cyclobacteriaceae bacterium]|nr:addiction module protein [Cyclobacteriaceae bacterium]
MNPKLKEILELSVAEKILLVEQIWDNISEAEKDEVSQLTAAQQKEIDRRLENYKQGKSETYTWEEVKSSLKKSS